MAGLVYTTPVLTFSIPAGGSVVNPVGDRRQALELLYGEGAVRLQQPAEHSGVSLMTIHRTLNDPEADGLMCCAVLCCAVQAAGSTALSTHRAGRVVQPAGDALWPELLQHDHQDKRIPHTEQKKMRVAVAGDSAGLPLAQTIAGHLSARQDLEVAEISEPPAGAEQYYAELAERVARSVLDGDYDRAVLCCGTGIGVCLSANKVPGIRAAQTHDTYSAERAALSNNAQIITLGARVVGPELANAIVDAFLACRFDENGRSAGNVAAINALDARYHQDR